MMTAKTDDPMPRAVVDSGYKTPFESRSFAAPLTFSASAILDTVHPSVTDRKMIFLVEMLRQSDGGFVAHVPSLLSASTQGKDYQEALMKVTESIEGILEDLEPEDLVRADRIEYLAGPEDFTISVVIPLHESA